jgi:hypothetical protein
MKIKFVPKENLVIRDSFILPFAGGEIWCTELDSLSIYTDIVKNKFLKDMVTICKPSLPAFIAINLTDTLVDLDMAELIVNELINVKRRLIKVAIIGLNGDGKRIFNSLFKKQNRPFSYRFFVEPENAKEWLIINKA